MNTNEMVVAKAGSCEVRAPSLAGARAASLPKPEPGHSRQRAHGKKTNQGVLWSFARKWLGRAPKYRKRKTVLHTPKEAPSDFVRCVANKSGKEKKSQRKQPVLEFLKKIKACR